jgi:hypothetical protein
MAGISPMRARPCCSQVARKRFGIGALVRSPFHHSSPPGTGLYLQARASPACTFGRVDRSAVMCPSLRRYLS